MDQSSKYITFEGFVSFVNPVKKLVRRNHLHVPGLRDWIKKAIEDGCIPLGTYDENIINRMGFKDWNSQWS